KLSPESIAKRTEAMAGRIRSAEHRASLSAALKGKPKSPAHIAQMSAAQKGKSRPPISEAHKAAIGNAHRGKVYSAETRAKISASRLKLFSSLKNDVAAS